MKPILEISQLGKKYRINSRQQPYLSLRSSLSDFLKNSGKKEEFWALRDLSFNVQPGETVGIIGRNGAGKSTLLKILSKITPPSEGSIISRGRVASLLEVGTGFHPELSGRENIYLNGSILGMRRVEIAAQFDAILDFAGVEKFIDTPLKHYSSGMQLRLAFAVAAFLEPEVLVIDEVLAVGDSEFQKKCLGKMKDVSEQGRTILLVSHDLNAISNLSKKALYLRNGVLQGYDHTQKIIEQYLLEGQQKPATFIKNPVPEITGPQITAVSMHTSMPANIHEQGKPLEIGIDIHTKVLPAHATWLSIHITDAKGRGMVHVTNGGDNIQLLRENNLNKLLVRFPELRLYLGHYLLSVYLAGPPNSEVYERLIEVLSFEVVMAGKQHEFGWVPEMCAYIEESEWRLQAAT